MPDQFKTLEERVIDLESLYSDMPQLLNLRFATFKSGHEEIAGRVAALERQQAMLINDVRDLRNGMIVQFRLQNEKIDRIEADVGTLKTDGVSLKSDVASLKSDVASLRSDVADVATDLAMLKTSAAEILSILRK